MVIDMHDCYIRVTALLESFEWMGHGFNHAINAKWLESTFGAISFYSLRGVFPHT